MSPELTMKVMVHESETYSQVGRDIYSKWLNYFFN